jgi:hypothetical protein
MAKAPQKPTGRAAQAAAHQGRAAPAARTATPARPATPAVRQPARQQVAPRDDEQLPAFMRDDAQMGKENISRDDLETPRLKLMQGLSKELQAYNDLRPGVFFHSAAEHIFDGEFTAVPVYMDKRYILWRPLDSGGGILARADDGVHWSPSSGKFEVTLDKKDGGHKVVWEVAPTVLESGLSQWGTQYPGDSNSPPAATLMYNFVLAFPDFPDMMPAVLSFQRSSIKSVRRFLTKLKVAQGPLFSRKYTFSPFVDHNGAGKEFYNINVSGAGLVEDEDEYLRYKALHESFADKGLTVKEEEELQAEEAGDAVADEAEDRAAAGGRRRF